MKRYTVGLVLALATAGAAWAQPAATPMTGRVISVESGIVTVVTDGATAMEPPELKVGDRVRLEAFPLAPQAPSSKRLVLGLSGLAVVGTFVLFRLRRPVTI